MCVFIAGCSDSQELAQLQAERDQLTAELARIKLVKQRTDEQSNPASNSVAPGIKIESRSDVEIAPGTTARVWELKASGVKQMSARLYVIREGASELVQGMTYSWSDDQPGAGDWRLTHLVRSGADFGLVDQWIPSIFCEFGDSPPNSTQRTSYSAPVQGKTPMATMSFNTNKTLRPDATFMHIALFEPPMAYSEVVFSNSLESMTAAATEGRVFVALEFEWEPVE
jgi:hypothetical protein